MSSSRVFQSCGQGGMICLSACSISSPHAQASHFPAHSLDRKVLGLESLREAYSRLAGDVRDGPLNDFDADGPGAEETTVGMASSPVSELIDANGHTVFVKQEHIEEGDYVAVNGPLLCIKAEPEEEIDDPIVVSDNANDPTKIIQVQPSDSSSAVNNGQVLLLLRDTEVENRTPNESQNRDRNWMRKDPQCEVWSCKTAATYGHSTGPSRCAQHRETWMVMFGPCTVEGCRKFGVASDDGNVRCEAHFTEERCRKAPLSAQTRALEHLVDDSDDGLAGLGLGLSLGDACRLHDCTGDGLVRQAEPAVVNETSVREGGCTLQDGTGIVTQPAKETRIAGSEGEDSGDAGQAGIVQEVPGRVASTSWSIPQFDESQPAVNLNHGCGQLTGRLNPEATSNSVQAEIHRLKEEHEGLREKMVKIEIELARLHGLQSSEQQQNETQAPPKKMTPRKPRQLQVQAAAVGGANEIIGGTTEAASAKVSLDGYNWRQYRVVKGPSPRVFYGCSNIGCIARKLEERTEVGHVKYTYAGSHNHPQPGKSLHHPAPVCQWKRRKRHCTAGDKVGQDAR